MSRIVKSIAMAMFAVVLSGVGSCSQDCKTYELRVSVNRWTGEPVNKLPLVLRADYQYHVLPEQQGQLVVYREVSEVFSGTTDEKGRLTLRRIPPKQFKTADLKTFKTSLVYAARTGTDVVLEPVRTRQFNDKGVCGHEDSFIVKLKPSFAKDSTNKRLELERRWAAEQNRELFVNGNYSEGSR